MPASPIVAELNLAGEADWFDQPLRKLPAPRSRAFESQNPAPESRVSRIQEDLALLGSR
jgi:hypothetical protein